MLRAAMASEWDELRDDFPALGEYVYLNAAATSPTPRLVREAVGEYYREMETGGDVHWNDWLERKEAVRSTVAGLVGAEAREIAFVPNTSAGMNLIADLLADDGAVLSDELEFPAVTLPWIHRGVPVHFLPAVEGVVRLEPFEVTNAPRAATIAISHVQFSNGCRLDLDAFGALKGDRHLVVSGSQSVGAFPIDVHRHKVDALATAGHKWLCAGYGAGFVYIHEKLLARPPRAIGWMSVEEPFTFDNRSYRVLDSHARTELGCPAFPAIFALGAAVAYLVSLGLDSIADRVLTLNGYLTFLLERARIPVLSPGGPHRSGETLVGVDDPAAAHAFLRERRILVTRKPEGLRISTHFYNSEADVERVVQALREYVAGRPGGAGPPGP